MSKDTHDIPITLTLPRYEIMTIIYALKELASQRASQDIRQAKEDGRIVYALANKVLTTTKEQFVAFEKMNNTPSNTNGTFVFQAVVRFEIDPETAAGLLVESDPTLTVHNWLLSQSPSPQDEPYSGNAEELRSQLGKYLAEKKVDQVRQLLPSGDVKALPF